MISVTRQAGRFVIVGAAATAVDFCVTAALVELAAAPAPASAAAGFCVSCALNYAASMRFVFAPRRDMRPIARAALFAALSLVGVAANWIVVAAAQHAVGYMAAKAEATALVTVWNFVSRKTFLEEKDAES